MFLKKFIYVNWGNIPQLEFEFGPINLLSGGNGSGKTTAADAIQTIMTAAHENLFQYNPGQDETTQRGRGGKRVRTLASYVLGCDDGSYARLDTTDGYLAAVFHPTDGEDGEAFTAMIGVRAWLDHSGQQPMARQDDAQFFILPGEQLSLSHLVREDNAGQYIAQLDKINALLVSEYGQRRVEKYDTKRAYLRRLYGILRGQNDSVTEIEAMNAARAFSRFMAYKPVQSINKFVADEILERKDLGEAIRSISSQLKTIHGMERDAGQLVDSIATLASAKQHAKLYIEQWVDVNVLDYTLAQSQYHQRQQAYLKAKRQQSEQQTSLKENEEQSALIQQRRQQAREQLIELEARRMGVAELQQKDQLQAQSDKHNEQLVEQATLLLTQRNQLESNLDATDEIESGMLNPELGQEIPLLADLNNQSLCRKILQLGKAGEIDLHALLNKDLTGDLSALEQHLDQAREAQHLHNQWRELWHDGTSGFSLREQLARLSHQREQRHQAVVQQAQQKQREVDRLEGHQVSYPDYVERAVAAIRQQCPAADPRVLCDHIEVTDAKWQSAIEGYLGGARFSILVEPKYEAEAIRVVRNMSGRDNRARVIQGSKAGEDASRMRLDQASVIHVLKFSHAVAKQYITASYGSLLRVESADELRRTRRGVTAEGMGSGSYSMWRCDLPDSQLVFGHGARERALVAKQNELHDLQDLALQARNNWHEVRDLLGAVDRLQPLDYANTISRMLSDHRELQRIDQQLQSIDLGEHQKLEQRLDDLREQELALGAKQDQLREHKGQLQEKMENLARECKRLDEQQAHTQEHVEKREENLQAIRSTWSDFDYQSRLAEADEEAQSLNLEIAQNHYQELLKQLRSTERRMDDELLRHNQQCRPVEQVHYHAFSGEYDAKLFTAICNLEREIDRVYNRLKNNILVEKHQQLGELKASFNNAFVTHLCHTIHQAINDGKKQIETLNRELQHHRFGADRETFRFGSDWIPEFRDYARFFDEVIKTPSMGGEVSLFDTELSKRSTKVRDEMMHMLLDEDEQKALRELERIADYRNYRRYEIYKEVDGKPPIALSEYGTGSGGQLETPAYIIRAAAITSAFRFGEGKTHLRMVLVDEAFSKMDETRSREVINYLTESLGLQLVFIMPTSKCGPFMDLISNEFVFAKCPSEHPRGQLSTRVLVDRKQCNQQKIAELWANHRRTIRHQAELAFLEELA